jgi:hypothetical protein
MIAALSLSVVRVARERGVVGGHQVRLAWVCPAAQPEVAVLVPARNRARASMGLRAEGSSIVVIGRLHE